MVFLVRALAKLRFPSTTDLKPTKRVVSFFYFAPMRRYHARATLTAVSALLQRLIANWSLFRVLKSDEGENAFEHDAAIFRQLCKFDFDQTKIIRISKHDPLTTLVCMTYC